MAQIIKKSDALAQKHATYRTLSIVGFAVCAISFIIFALTMGNFEFDGSILLLLGFGGGGLFGTLMNQKASVYASGVQGENATADIVRALPNQYFGVQNLKVTYDGKESELDMVVVGPTGVFIIETKNMKGTIVGNYDSPQWSQRKVGQNGTPYSKSFYNPVKQVGTHVYRLANHLRSNGFNVRIESMVYFSNPDAVLQVLGTPSQTPVYSALANGTGDLHRFIMEREKKLTGEQVVALAKYFNR